MRISGAAFAYVCDLMRHETAMSYGRGKEYLVEARLDPLARALGDTTLDAYVRRLTVDAAERRRAIDALTINETSWFRDTEPFGAFTATILPELLDARSETRHISIWSAACSSGQEAYSLAMLLSEHLPAGWTADILATDVCGAMVERTRVGCYSRMEMKRGLPAAMMLKHFTRIDDVWQVSPELRAMVHTAELNLAAPFPALPTFDVVLLRNVLIYFDTAVKREVLRRARGVTAPDGFLLLGTSETTLDLEEHWRREPIGRVMAHRPTPILSFIRQIGRAGVPASLAVAGAGAS